MRESPLARILFTVYIALVVYASLYPLEGWRDHGLPLLAYLSAPWSRFVTGFDVAANLLGYVPYGFLCVAALYPRVQSGAALGVATLSGLALSLVLEGAQSYLPARVATGLDVLCNVAGAALGALAGLALVQQLLEEGPFKRLRAAFTPGVEMDVGLALIALWLFTQLNPATLLFATGDLRDIVAPHETRAHAPVFFAAIEAFAAGANLVAVALLVSALAAPGARVRALFAALVGVALAVRTAAFAIVMHAEHVFFCCNQRDGGRTCCNDKGASAMRDYAKQRVKELELSGPGKVRINQAGCLDRCEEGPCVVVYPDAVWYTYVDRSDIDEIIEEHLRHGRIVERLRM